MEKRLVSSEFNQVKRFAAFLSELNYLRDGLSTHWEMVENGEERIQKCLDESLQLFDELLDTIPKNQIKTLKNATVDYAVAFIPKIGPAAQNVVIDKEYVKQLIDLAHEQCKFCVKDPNEAEECPIFKLSTGVVPPDTYESFLCPYSQAEWKD